MQAQGDIADKPPVDLTHLRRYTFGNEELEHELLGLFIDHAPQTLAELAAAKTQKDWHAAAHALKGSARAVGAHAVADLATAAERLDIGDEAGRQSQLRVLATALAAARDFIEGHRAAAQP